MEHWTESVKVEEQNLQEYLCQKQHTVVLQGAVQTLKHTLVPVPTTNGGDGYVHFGDMLTLRSACTRGLLQVDAAETTVSAGSTEAIGYGLSTGSVITSCPRTNLTVCRVDDNDRFGRDDRLHFDQLIRLGTHEGLHERPHYLFASGNSKDEEPQLCVCPRAASGSHWRLRPIRTQSDSRSPEEEDDRVKLGDSICLESVATGFELQSNTVVVMTSYGNEYKVFAAKGHIPGGQADRGRSFEWAFVDDRWSDQVIVAAKEKNGLEITNGGSVYKVDPVAMLKDPLYRAEAQLAHLDANGAGENRYAVLTRIYPILRHRDMHMIRRLRRMCAAADEQGTGVIRRHIFHGLLSWVCIRLTREEANQLQTLFGCDETGQLTEEGRDLINYHRFLRLMGASMSNFRLEAVKDAWKKLEDSAIAAMVDITHLQRLFRAEAFPKAQDGSMSLDEAREEFLRQWELDHPEGRITWDAFKQYYEDVSLAVEDDELFVELVRKSWKL